jgi:hypothetical protein
MEPEIKTITLVIESDFENFYHLFGLKIQAHTVVL